MNGEFGTERQKWSYLNRKQKLQYFLDYYLLYSVIIAGAAAILIFLGWHFLKPPQENILYVAVIDESLDGKMTEQLKERMEERFKADGKRKQVLIDDSFYSKEDGIQKLEIYVQSNQVDIVIAPPEIFDLLAGFGFMQDAEDVLGESAKHYDGDFYRAAGYKETEGVSFEDRETGQGEIKNYGVKISDSQAYRQLKPMTKEPILGFVVDMPNQERAVEFFEMLEER